MDTELEKLRKAIERYRNLLRLNTDKDVQKALQQLIDEAELNLANLEKESGT